MPTWSSGYQIAVGSVTTGTSKFDDVGIADHTTYETDIHTSATSSITGLYNLPGSSGWTAVKTIDTSLWVKGSASWVLEYSNDGTTWTNVGLPAPVSNAWSDQSKVLSPTVSAKYWRVSVKGTFAGVSTESRIGDFRLYDASGVEITDGIGGSGGSTNTCAASLTSVGAFSAARLLNQMQMACPLVSVLSTSHANLNGVILKKKLTGIGKFKKAKLVNVGVVPLTSSLTGVSSLTGGVSAFPNVAASLSGISQLNATLQQGLSLSAALGGVGSLTPGVSNATAITTALSGVSALSGAFGNGAVNMSCALGGVAASDSLMTVVETSAADGATPLVILAGLNGAIPQGTMKSVADSFSGGLVESAGMQSIYDTSGGSYPQGATNPPLMVPVFVEGGPFTSAQWVISYTVYNPWPGGSADYQVRLNDNTAGQEDRGPQHGSPYGPHGVGYGLNYYTDQFDFTDQSLAALNAHNGMTWNVPVEFLAFPNYLIYYGWLDAQAVWQFNGFYILATPAPVAIGGRAWSADHYKEQVLVGYIGTDGALYTSAHTAIAGKIGTNNGWQTPLQIAPYASDVNLGFYPNGTLYLTYTATDSAGSNPASKFRISRGFGMGSSVSDYGAETDVPSGLDSFSRPTAPYGNYQDWQGNLHYVTSQSAGTGRDFFGRGGNRLFNVNTRLYNGGANNWLIASQSEDGLLWQAEQDNVTGPFWGEQATFQASSNVQDDGWKGINNVYGDIDGTGLTACLGYSQVVYQENTQPNFITTPVSPIVRLGDNTLAQLVFSNVYLKTRPISPSNWTWDNAGTQPLLDKSVSAQVPSGNAPAQVTYLLLYDEDPESIVSGTIPAGSGQPGSVSFRVPSNLRYPTNAYQVGILFDHVTYTGAHNSWVVVGSDDTSGYTPSGSHFYNGGSGALYGFGKVESTAPTYFNRNGANVLWLNLTDTAQILNNPGKSVTLPLTYLGSGAFNVTSVKLVFRAFFSDSVMAGYNNTLTAIASSTGNPATSPCYPAGTALAGTMTAGDMSGLSLQGGTPDDFLTDLGQAAGSSFAFTLELATTNTPYNKPAPHWRVNVREGLACYRYEDSAGDFRLVRSRDNGATWEYAADAAPIAALSNLRDFNNQTTSPLMPSLLADQHLLTIVWLENGSVASVTSADTGETWV